MTVNRKEKINRIVFALNSFLFIMGAIDPLSQGKMLFGGIQLLAGISNFAFLLSLRKEKPNFWLNRLVLLMNVIVAIFVGLDQIAAGKQYIQYAWFFAAFASVVALFIQVRKEKAGTAVG